MALEARPHRDTTSAMAVAAHTAKLPLMILYQTSRGVAMSASPSVMWSIVGNHYAM